MRRLLTRSILAVSISFSTLFGISIPGSALPFGPSPTQAQEIGFLEEFALAENRESVLKRLVPGTESYYFFHCLHYQHTQQLDKVDLLLDPWIKRFGYTEQVNQIRNRNALLKYSDDPAATLEYLRQQLNLNFNHQREIPQTQRDLPTSFDPKLLDEDQLIAAALKRYKNSDGFTDDGLRLLAKTALDKIQLRHLLQRIQYPDFPDLVNLIARDLKERDSQPFGSMPIHQSLTLKQLDELAKKTPTLSSQDNYVNLYLSKLAPREDTNWLADFESHQRYLDRLWTFVKNLPSVHNSLKANILFRKLDLDRSHGTYNRELFLTYLKLPRHVGYINPVVLKQLPEQNQIADLNRNFSQQTQLAPIFDDQTLILDYLHEFLVDANDTTDFQPYIKTKYLDQQFATVKILHGLGDAERWISLLEPEQYRQLMERVDLDFVATNSETFSPDAEVSLGLFTKNINSLIVKVFEINTENYYRKYNSEIDTNINLDGLVPNFEQTFQYDDAPALRIKREFKLPQVSKRGVYIVDFIAGGKSSRALIRKGRFQIINRTTAAGPLFSVIDSAGTVIADASLWIGGRRFNANEDGKILVPFSTQPGPENAIITQADFSCLQLFEHVAETYQFDAALVLDRESLIRSNKAQLLIRPMLRIAGGEAVPLELLKNPKLVVTSVNLDGISATKTITNLTLSAATDTICPFIVPPRLKSLAFSFSAEIENISRNETQTVSANQSYSVNEIDSSEFIQDIHLAPTASGHVIEVRGKTGEPRAKQGVHVSLRLSRFNDPIEVDLQSNQEGQIELGELKNVQSITAKLNNGSTKSWPLTTANQTYPKTINIRADDDIVLPAPADLSQIRRSRVALFEIRRGTIVADWYDAITLNKGLLSLKRLKAGDYLLTIIGEDQTRHHKIDIHVTDGKPAANALVGEFRTLENRARSSLTIQSVESGEDTIKIKIANSTPQTRVHVFADRYQAPFDAFELFSQIRDIEPWLYRPAIRKSVYMEGRKIGDEYQYILDRKYAVKYPGNMLTRPSLLSNPWATNSTDNQSQLAADGSEFQQAGNDPDSQSKRSKSQNSSTSKNVDFANLDFLGRQNAVINNLQPDENGTITLDRKQLGPNQHIRIVALDAFSTTQREFNLPLAIVEPRDGRLANALNPAEHFSQRKQVQVLKSGDNLKIADITAAKFQYYDDLGDVFRLFTALNPDTNLNKFDFVLDWENLSEKKKRELYSEFACHELNFFLLKKDASFFDSVVKPHLANKRDRTFFDHWLLNENLDSYVEPWQYARLNTLERILLSQRLENQSADIVRNLDELYLLTPTPRGQFDQLFDSSIRGLALDDEIASRLSRLDRKNELPKLRQLAEESDANGAGEDSWQMNAAGQVAPNSTRPPIALGVAPMFAAPSEKSESESLDKQLFAGKRGAGTDESPGRMSVRSHSRFAKPDSLRRKENNIRLETREKKMASGSVEFYEVEVPENEHFNYGLEISELALLRDQSRSLFRRLPPTQQWMENNYYQLLPENQSTDLVSINRFWRDYASHDGGAFLSPNFIEAHRTFTEIMFALAVLDLPQKSPEQKLNYNDNQLTFTAAGPTIVFHQQVETAIVEGGNTTILVSENFFQADDRYRYQDDLRFDKFISEKFHAHTQYGGQVVITNPTSTPRAVDLLIQIPQGSVTTNGSQETKTIQLDLEAFSTKTFEYWFYFPTAGKFTHYPAHVSADEKVLAIAEPVSFVVIDQPVDVDQTSWAYVSQNATPDDVVDFLNRENILRLNLDKIAFRMTDKEFYLRAIKTLRDRLVYNHTLWSYSIQHDDRESINEFLTHADSIAQKCGPYFDSKLLRLDPVERNWYQHREYWPLVNARSHQLGPQRKILNPSFYSQYQQLMNVLAHRPSLTNDDHLVVSYYMLLQDRIESAMKHFEQTNSDSLKCRIQYDYCDAYLDMYRSQPDTAARKAEAWADYPVDLWRKRFENILAQVAEIRGRDTKVVDGLDQAQKQTELAARSASFDFEVEAGEIKINAINTRQLVLNFYEMDIELLFSRSPFAQNEMDGFSMIRPNSTESIELDLDEAKRGKADIKLPDELRNRNVLIEIVSGDQAKSKPYFAHTIDVQLQENYGQLQISDEAKHQPLPQTYIKVYARMDDGSEQFHKDGYTDLRGRFDYVSQSNHAMDGIQEFSILILSEQQGAVIRQAKPPTE